MAQGEQSASHVPEVFGEEANQIQKRPGKIFNFIFFQGRGESVQKRRGRIESKAGLKRKWGQAIKVPGVVGGGGFRDRGRFFHNPQGKKENRKETMDVLDWTPGEPLFW